MSTVTPTASSKTLTGDDSLLRHLFCKVLDGHDIELGHTVDRIHGLAAKWCNGEDAESFEALVEEIRSLEGNNKVMIASAFSQMINLHNLTEEVADIITTDEANKPSSESALPWIKLSMESLKESDVSSKDVYEALCGQCVELIFTAHPTQALRRELMSCYRHMQAALMCMHQSGKSECEKEEYEMQLRALVQRAWRTDEVHRQKPTPRDEMRDGLATFADVIFHTLPKYTRHLDTWLQSMDQPALPLDHVPFKFGSWMGGDRDGNPNVTHLTTREVCLVTRLTACDLYMKEIEQLMFELSLWRANDELKQTVEKLVDNMDKDEVTAERKRRNYPDFWTPFEKREPFRVILADIRDKLFNTREILHELLRHPKTNVNEELERRMTELEIHDRLKSPEDSGYIRNVEDLIHPLTMMYNSLIETGDCYVANGHLLDIIRQVNAFGLSIVPLDIRQESTRHAEAMNAITEFLGYGSYQEWSEEKRMEFLEAELKGRRPLLSPEMEMDSNVKEVIDTFRVLSTLPSDSLAAYVISMARSASDVLVVMLLQRECGMKKLLRVVPLFETLNDLDNAPTAIRQLFSNEWYRSAIEGKQECMIGYSDSGKDAGRLAAAWALYQVQRELVSVAEKFGIELTLFHGRGGTVGRGGGPAHFAIKSQPPGTIKGKMRVTIQGEIIAQQFGEREVCHSTLDMYTSAVLEATLSKRDCEPETRWTELITQMAKDSCEAYRGVVRDDGFVSYFRQLTPVTELAKLNIGSRPSARKKTGGIETLRAIPWIFAWNQTRLLLPVWLGFSEAIQNAVNSDNKDTLVEMYQKWTFFKVTVDLVEMVLSKVDVSIVEMYEKQLVHDEDLLTRFGQNLRQRFLQTKELLSEVTGHGSQGLADSKADPRLSTKLKLRAPCVAPLNLLQIECLKALRAAEAETNGESAAADLQHISDALIITIKGIAAGLQNTG